jgi:hypothetical protein
MLALQFSNVDPADLGNGFRPSRSMRRGQAALFGAHHGQELTRPAARLEGIFPAASLGLTIPSLLVSGISGQQVSRLLKRFAKSSSYRCSSGNTRSMCSFSSHLITSSRNARVNSMSSLASCLVAPPARSYSTILRLLRQVSR